MDVIFLEDFLCMFLKLNLQFGPIYRVMNPINYFSCGEFISNAATKNKPAICIEIFRKSTETCRSICMLSSVSNSLKF
jgi:hypothetical protein